MEILRRISHARSRVNCHRTSDSLTLRVVGGARPKNAADKMGDITGQNRRSIFGGDGYHAGIKDTIRKVKVEVY